MITENELRIANESYTHKDFYQIYPEILDIAQQISRLWDPASSNESDPGVVLLKLLAFIADKNNYNIDKNILEAFMPSATQEESMRKLCEMMGYNMKYYQSAVADVSFMWIGDHLSDSSNGNSIHIDKWTELTDDSGEIVYTLTEDVQLNYKGEIQTKPAIEGKLCDVMINDDNLVKLFNLDDNHRFYLPESKIAENGIWIANTAEEEGKEDWSVWRKTDNLNTELSKQPVWKFGYSSKKMLPYIQFPEDIADLIGDGLRIKYIRTSGINGNITAKTLTKLSSQTTVDFYEGTEKTEDLDISVDNDNYLVIENSAYTLNGQNFETLDDAYNGFKKTVGTFNTLIACRDYANKIYQLTYNKTNRSPLVSNVQVSDIKDDINFSTKIVSFDDYGLFYTNLAYLEHGEGITNFDIYIYPLTDTVNYYKGNNYKNSFKPNYTNTYEILTQLEDYKCLAHNIKQIPNTDSSVGARNIYAIKNYYHLDAKIATTYKVTEYEGTEILNNIYYALWNTFNARKVDYGEELPYDVLLKTIEQADSRIKSVSLDEPEISTNVMFGNGNEQEIINIDGNSISDENDIFLHLVAKNVLAGRVPLFKYDRRFKYDLQTQAEDNRIYGQALKYPLGPVDPNEEYAITAISTELKINAGIQDYELKENEVINLIIPNLASDNIYAAYVNYYFRATPSKIIDKNTEYQLKADEALYLNYTDSNELVHDIKIYKDALSTKFYIEDNGRKKECSGIIKPNFDLQESSSENARRTWQKTSGSTFIDRQSPDPSSDKLPGMFTLGGTEQIETRNLVKTEIKTSPFNCYWSLNTDKLKFKQDSSDSQLYVRILENDEYFFYTDTLKQTLVTLGSGTSLKLHYEGVPTQIDGVNYVVWSLNSSSVSLDDIASQGIGAFSDTNWHEEKLNQSYWIQIQENQIITLGEGAILNNFTLNPSGDLTHEWKEIAYVDGEPQFEYEYEGAGSLPKYDISGLEGYKVQTNFNLNMSSTEGQVINLAETGVSRKIQLWTSQWTKEGQIVDYSEDDKDKLTETHLPYKSFESGADKYYLRSNYTLNQTGGDLLNEHRYTIEEKLKDDLYVYPYRIEAITAEDKEGNATNVRLQVYADDYTKINLTDLKEFVIPVFIPSSSFGLIMLYYSPTFDIEDNLKVEGTAINFFGESTSTTSVTLKKGINILKIWETTTALTFKVDDDDQGTLIMSELDVVKQNDANDTGVNCKLLNIPETDVNKLFTIINDLDKDGIFYYNAPINKYTEIDTNTLDQYSFFNYNNMCNKFTIAELDTDNSSIQIAKSSRATKW